MPYTIEDYRRDYVLDYLDRLTPDERLKGLPPDERLKGLSPEEIEAYLKKLKRKKKSRKL